MATSTETIALITGANKGLGFETARQLASEGITVVLAARDPKAGREASAKLQAEGLPVEFFKLDLGNPADHHAAAKFLEERFGKLDILINNAGVLLDGGLFQNHTSQTEPDLLRRTFETNFFGTVALTQALLPLIRKSPAGRIVNLSSILGSLTLQSDPSSPIYNAKSFAYNSSKAALNAFTVHLAHELKDTRIKVNSVHPGWVKTDMGTDAAPMEIPEGAKTSVALATVAADGPTGAFIHLGKPLPW